MHKMGGGVTVLKSVDVVCATHHYARAGTQCGGAIVLLSLHHRLPHRPILSPSVSRLDVSAEGVETLQEFRWFEDHGIWLFQGYLFAKPAFERFPPAFYPDAAIKQK